MSSTVLSTIIETETRPSEHSPHSPVVLLPPAKAISRVYPGAPHRDESIELQRLQHPHEEIRELAPAEVNPDLEMSRPVSPAPSIDGVEALHGVWEPYMNRFRLAAVCLMYLTGGLNDSAAGALIPYMET
jgi:hypothetical protein